MKKFGITLVLAAWVVLGSWTHAFACNSGAVGQGTVTAGSPLNVYEGVPPGTYCEYTSARYHGTFLGHTENPYQFYGGNFPNDYAEAIGAYPSGTYYYTSKGGVWTTYNALVPATQPLYNASGTLCGYTTGGQSGITWWNTANSACFQP